jgi:hypothetical protein
MFVANPSYFLFGFVPTVVDFVVAMTFIVLPPVVMIVLFGYTTIKLLPIVNNEKELVKELVKECVSRPVKKGPAVSPNTRVHVSHPISPAPPSVSVSSSWSSPPSTIARLQKAESVRRVVTLRNDKSHDFYHVQTNRVIDRDRRIVTIVSKDPNEEDYCRHRPGYSYSIIRLAVVFYTTYDTNNSYPHFTKGRGSTVHAYRI